MTNQLYVYVGSVYQGGEGMSGSRRGSVSSEPTEVAPSHIKLVKENYKFWYKVRKGGVWKNLLVKTHLKENNSMFIFFLICLF